ncbi:MAG: 50S ribosomal protein L28 [Gemmatimonadota bacterium]
MSRICDISGSRPNSANNVSHAQNKSKRRQLPNLQRKRIWVPSLNRFVRVRVTTRILKSIDKVGLERTLEKNGLELDDIL